MDNGCGKAVALTAARWEISKQIRLHSPASRTPDNRLAYIHSGMHIAGCFAPASACTAAAPTGTLAATAAAATAMAAAATGATRQM
eukprot:4579209-Prymnesium_polylepis.1